MLIHLYIISVCFSILILPCQTWLTRNQCMCVSMCLCSCLCVCACVCVCVCVFVLVSVSVSMSVCSCLCLCLCVCACVCVCVFMLVSVSEFSFDSTRFYLYQHSILFVSRKLYRTSCGTKKIIYSSYLEVSIPSFSLYSITQYSIIFSIYQCFVCNTSSFWEYKKVKTIFVMYSNVHKIHTHVYAPLCTLSAYYNTYTYVYVHTCTYIHTCIVTK